MFFVPWAKSLQKWALPEMRLQMLYVPPFRPTNTYEKDHWSNNCWISVFKIVLLLESRETKSKQKNLLSFFKVHCKYKNCTQTEGNSGNNKWRQVLGSSISEFPFTTAKDLYTRSRNVRCFLSLVDKEHAVVKTFLRYRVCAPFKTSSRFEQKRSNKRNKDQWEELDIQGWVFCFFISKWYDNKGGVPHSTSSMFRCFSSSYPQNWMVFMFLRPS